MAKRSNTQVSDPVGPRDMVRADGSYDWAVIKTLARRKAVAEVEKVQRWIAQGRLTVEYATTLRKEAREALSYYRDIAKISWSLHPANRHLVKLSTITPYGRDRQGVRFSAF